MIKTYSYTIYYDIQSTQHKQFWIEFMDLLFLVRPCTLHSFKECN